MAVLQLAAVEDLFRSLKSPSAKHGVRVLELEVDPKAKLGVGAQRANPWLKLSKAPWPLTEIDAALLSSYCVSLSLADFLTHGQAEKHPVALAFLLALVRISPDALDQLCAHGQLPLVIRPQPSGKSAAVAAEIQKLCWARQAGQGEYVSGGASDWTRWASSYQVWITSGGERLATVQAKGMPKAACQFDMGGVHLTGGRVWAGALVLMQWASAVLTGSEAKFGSGPVLELGAGTGIAGIALAKLGKRVVLSDREPALLECMRANVERNDVEDQCRILDFDWAAAGQPKMARRLAAQHFGAVIGAEVLYGDEAQADLLWGAVRHALPAGGLAMFVNSRHHRGKASGVFSTVLRENGCDVVEDFLPCSAVMQDLVCGDYEPGQEISLFVVQVPGSN